MRRTIGLLGLVLPWAVHAASQDVLVTNRTGYQIDTMYVTEAGRRDWGNDVMGRGSLRQGEQAEVTFDRNTAVCRWDVRVRYHDATEAVWTGLNLCAIRSLTLVWDPTIRLTRAVAE